MRNLTELWKAYIAEQRELVKLQDPAALSPRTIRDYTKMMERHVLPEFGSMKPNSFKATHAAQYIRAQRLAGRPIRGNREMSCLGSVFAYGMSVGACDSNPCKGVRRNKEMARTRSVSIAEVNTLLEIASQGVSGGLLMVSLIAVTVALTGRRRGEVLGLPVEALTDEGIEVVDTKTRRYGERRYLVRWSPMLKSVIEKAKALRPGTGWVFPTRYGNPYADGSFRREWAVMMNLYKKATGDRFRAHDLRALYVSTMLGRGQDPNTHRNESTMRRVYDRRRVVTVKPLA